MRAPTSLLLLLGACGPVFELRVDIFLTQEELEPFSPSWPLAITTSRRGEVLVQNVWCVPERQAEVLHVWQQRGGCRIPEALLVRVETASLSGGLGCDVDSPVSGTTPLDPPLELYWTRDDDDDCEQDGDRQVFRVELGLSR